MRVLVALTRLPLALRVESITSTHIRYTPGIRCETTYQSSSPLISLCL